MLHVRAVQRADQEITECISVDVEGDVVEVRDVRVKVRSVFERVEDFTLLAVILFRALAPRLGHFLRRHRTLGAHGVHLFFKFIKRALTHDGVDDVVHLGHDHRQTIFIARSLLQQVTEHNHFSKDARGFRERERRVELQDSLRVTQLEMHRVARLVRQRGDVTRGVGEVEELERAGAVRRRAVCAASFPVLRRHVDALFVDELREHVRHSGRKLVVALVHEFHRLFPRVVVLARTDVDGSVAIGPSEGFKSLRRLQDLFLQRVVLLAVIHSRGRHGGQERVDDVVGQVVAQVARRTQILKPALLVFDCP